MARSYSVFVHQKIIDVGLIQRSQYFSFFQIKEYFIARITKDRLLFLFFGFPSRQLSERDQSFTSAFMLCTRKQMKKGGEIFCAGVRETNKTGPFNDHTLTINLYRDFGG